VDLYNHSPTRLHGVVLNYLSTETNFTFTSWDILYIRGGLNSIFSGSSSLNYIYLIDLAEL
jgi:hypothetical protein